MLRSAKKITLEGVLAGAVLIAGTTNLESQQSSTLSLQKSNNTIVVNANNLNVSNNYSLFSSPTLSGLSSAPSEKTNFSATQNSMSFAFPINLGSEFFRLRETRPLVDDGQMKVVGGRKSGNNFEFEAVNLTPGNFYSPYSINITDQFVPLKRKSTVEALTTTQTFSVPMNSTNEFFGVMDLDKYSGPDLKATYPQANQVVSGSNVRVGFSSHDIFPHRVEAYVEDSTGNYKYLGNIEEGQPEFNFNSQILQNGPARVYLIATGKEGIPVTIPADPEQPDFGDQQSTYYFSTHKALDLIISNNIYAEAFEDMTGSRSGYLNLINLDNSDTQNYNFKVKDENGNLFKEEIFNFTDGRANLYWDGSSNGFPINVLFDEANYSVERVNFAQTLSTKKYPKGVVIHNNNNGGGGGNSNLVFESTSVFSSGITLNPRLFVTTKFPDQPETDLVYRLVDAAKESTDFWALWDNDREVISRGSYAFYNNPIKVTPANQNGEGPMALNIITNWGISSFFYIGHGSPSHIVGDPSDSITYQLNARDIANGLNNHFDYNSVTLPDGSRVRKFKYKMRGRFLDSWLHSCSGALNDSFSIAFGTPPIDFTKYPNVSPSMFFSYKGMVALNYDLENFARMTDLRWVSDWNAMNSINVSLSEYPKILPAGPFAFGHPFVTYARGAIRP